MNDRHKDNLTPGEKRASDAVPWLQVSPEQLSVTLLEVPSRESIPIPIQEQLIVELYSK